MSDNVQRLELQRLELKFPVDFGDERIESLTFRRLKARDLRSISTKPTMDDFLKLVSQSTGLNMSQVNELDLEDALAAVDIVSDFFTSGQKNGEQL